MIFKKKHKCKFKVIKKQLNTMYRHFGNGHKIEHEVISVLEKCSCGKLKAYQKDMRGNIDKLDLDYIEITKYFDDKSDN